MISGDIYIGQPVESESDVANVARFLNDDFKTLSDSDVMDRLNEEDGVNGTGVIDTVGMPFQLIGDREYDPINYDSIKKTVELVVRSHLYEDGGIVGVKLTSQFVPFLLDATSEGSQYGRPNPFKIDFDACRKIRNHVRQKFTWFDADVYLMDTDYS